MFNSVSYVSNGKVAFFHYHGEDDEWVPVSQGDTLYDAAQKGITISSVCQSTGIWCAARRAHDGRVD